MSNKQWCLLWSHSQNSIHVEPMEDMLSLNRKRYRDDVFVNDYLPIHVGTQAEVEAAADAIRNTLAQRAFYGEPVAEEAA